MQTRFMLLQHHYARRCHLEVENKYPCHSVDLYTHMSLFEKATPVLKLGLFWLRKSCQSLVTSIASQRCCLNRTRIKDQRQPKFQYLSTTSGTVRVHRGLLRHLIRNRYVLAHVRVHRGLLRHLIRNRYVLAHLSCLFIAVITLVISYSKSTYILQYRLFSRVQGK